MKLLKFTLLFTVIVFIASCSRSTTVKGEIFLTNPDGDNQRMAAATIKVWRDSDFVKTEGPSFKAVSDSINDSLNLEEACRENEVRWALTQPNFNKCIEERNERTLNAYLTSLPDPNLVVTTATTNANGEFSFALAEAGRYVMIAEVSRPDPSGFTSKYVFRATLDTKNKSDQVLSIGNSQLVVRPDKFNY